MVGRATLTEDIVNGPIKDVRVVTNRADFICNSYHIGYDEFSNC